MPNCTPELGANEFCVVSPSRIEYNPDPAAAIGYRTRTRFAHTRYELHTGGKGIFNQKNLFVGSASARGVGDPFCPEVDSVDPGGWDIAYTNIMLGGLGRLGSDGLVYTVIADNATKDIKPTVQGNPYYTFSEPWATKHKLISSTLHLALTNTNRDRTTLGVGEEVSIYFDPELDMTFPETPIWLAFDGSVSPNVGSWVTFTAPSNAVPSTLCGSLSAMSSLTKIFSVKEPSRWDHADIISTNYFLPGTMGAEMKLKVFIAPTDILLYRVEIEEVGQYAINIWGWFTNGAPHHDADVFAGLNDDNSWTDECEGGADGCPGGYTWPIPAKWKIPGGPTNSMNQWSQIFSVYAAAPPR